MKLAPALLFAIAAPLVAQTQVKTPYYSLTLAADGTTIQSLSLDSLGRGQFRPSALFPPAANSPAPAHSGWTFKSSTKSFELISTYGKSVPPSSINLSFNPERTHATLLAVINQGRASVPALLHLPEYGSLRIQATSRVPVRLGYDARRKGKDFINVTFPAATAENPRIVYAFTVVAIYPRIPGIEHDPRYDGFRRDYLNIFQMQAFDGILANNSASDPCAFVMHMYSEVAKYAPPLAPGLTAMDLVRVSLDKYLGGFLAYGMPGYRMFDSAGSGLTGYTTPTADTYPSLLVAAADYVTTTHDAAWLLKNYAGLRAWADAVLATDTNGDGLIKYAGASGDSGSWNPPPHGIDLRPSNWWDTIGFGYEDAYANALAYHALEEIAAMAQLADQPADAARFRQRADQLRAAYLPAFFDPRTGVLAGWRSEDGKLHDYYFLFVNGAAVVYGLVPPEQSNAIFDRLLAKMKDVDYTNFSFGLPGNLIPIQREDYASRSQRWGAPLKEDGSDGFQIYENGGVTASFANYTIVALYKLGRVGDADRILFPMLNAFTKGGFEGRGSNGRTYDWKKWDGTPEGYERFLADCYMALVSVMKRPAEVGTK